MAHVQQPLDEYNYSVTNLAVDLRDGVRLVRLIEMQTKDYSLHARLRFPTPTKQQMVHNVQLALDALSQCGIALDDGVKGGMIVAKDMVEGHREKTLMLLWKMIFAWRISFIVDKWELGAEVERLKRILGSRFVPDEDEELVCGNARASIAQITGLVTYLSPRTLCTSKATNYHYCSNGAACSAHDTVFPSTTSPHPSLMDARYAY